jgi:esterase FrsA
MERLSRNSELKVSKGTVASVRNKILITVAAVSGIARIASGTACVLAVAAFFTVAPRTLAQVRTLAQLKTEVQRRAERQDYPCEGLKPDDVREVLARLRSLAPDDWAAAWSFMGDRYRDKAQREMSSSPSLADKDFVQAWIYYNFGRWPAPTSLGKQAAYQKAVGAYLAHGRLLHPVLEVVQIPFEGKEITAYVQMPTNKKVAPIVVAIPGIDRGKESMAEAVRPLVDAGVGYLAVDAPGTGQSPIKAGPDAGRMLDRVIDYALQREDVDKSRVAVYGVSFGGFWATQLAATERTHLRAVVAQSPPVNESFMRARTMKMPENREYLFDYVQAYETMFGVTTLTQLADVREKMSLKTRGLLDAPMTSFLVIGGARDTQVPISDLDLLLNSGQTPKQAWINPQGGHMGRSAAWSGKRIFDTVIEPWLLRKLTNKTE